MLTLLVDFSDKVQLFNVFRYITFRTGGALITSALIVFMFGPTIIDSLRLRQGKGQPIRADVPASHLVSKKGTPTMGGMLILFAVTVSTILWANLSVVYIWLVLLVTVGFGLIGFLDDYRKLAVRNSRGVPGKVRLAAEIIIALFVGVVLYFKPGFSAQVTIPFCKGLTPPISNDSDGESARHKCSFVRAQRLRRRSNIRTSADHAPALP